jgi:hypothetical protein
MGWLGSGKVIGIDAERFERLEGRVAECAEVLGENRDSPDPVALRRVAQALRAKAEALARLGRRAECIAIWDEMVARFADAPPWGSNRSGGGARPASKNARRRRRPDRAHRL